MTADLMIAAAAGTISFLIAGLVDDLERRARDLLELAEQLHAILPPRLAEETTIVGTTRGVA